MNFTFGRIFGSMAGLWLCPFRPFFLLTAAHGALAIAWWVAMLTGILPLPEVVGGPVVWHAHELLFGFATASIAGFLLTAVPEFTGTISITRRRLQGLVALWLGGRLAFVLSGTLGVLPAAIFDLGLLALLLASVAKPLWQQPSRRHLAFFHTLLALGAVHAGFYLALHRGGDAFPWLRLGIGLLMTLIVIALSRISMRLVNDVLETQDGFAAPYLARPPRRNLAIVAIAAYSLGEFVLSGNAVCGWLALAAAAAIFNLLNDWHVGRALLQRWVLIPYLAYWCMALGYAAIGWGLLSGRPLTSAGEHLLLVGALGLSVLIVMAVAGRMHSGYGLDRRRWLPVVACLLLLAGLLRASAGIPAWSIAYTPLLQSAALLWLAAWSSYLAYSWNVLAGPRPDHGQGCDERRP